MMTLSPVGNRLAHTISPLSPHHPTAQPTADIQETVSGFSSHHPFTTGERRWRTPQDPVARSGRSRGEDCLLESSPQLTATQAAFCPGQSPVTSHRQPQASGDESRDNQPNVSQIPTVSSVETKKIRDREFYQNLVGVASKLSRRRMTLCRRHPSREREEEPVQNFDDELQARLSASSCSPASALFRP